MTTEVIIADNTVPLAPAVPAIGGEIPTEPVADAAVEIAQIQADRDVKLAEIHTEAEAERVAIVEKVWTAQDADNERKREIEQCRAEITELKTGQTTIAETLQSILTKLTPAEPPPPNLPPESVEKTPDNPEASVPTPEPPKPKKRHKWI